jgi:hypothetical protein
VKSDVYNRPQLAAHKINRQEDGDDGGNDK